MLKFHGRNLAQSVGGETGGSADSLCESGEKRGKDHERTDQSPKPCQYLPHGAHEAAFCTGRYRSMLLSI